MKPCLRCQNCGEQKSLYLHHGKLFCAGCLEPAEGDDVSVKAQILRIRMEAAHSETRRIRKKGK